MDNRTDNQSSDTWVYVLPFFRSIFFLDRSKWNIAGRKRMSDKNPGLSVTYLLHCPEIKTLIPIIHPYFMQITKGQMRSFSRYKCSEVIILECQWQRLADTRVRSLFISVFQFG